MTKNNLFSYRVINEYNVIDVFNGNAFNFTDSNDFTSKKYLSKNIIEQKYFLKHNDIIIKFRSGLEFMFVDKIYNSILIPSSFIIIRSNSRQNQLLLWYLLNNRYKRTLLTQFNANSRTTYLSVNDITSVIINSDLQNVEYNKLQLYICLQKYKKLQKRKNELITKITRKIFEGDK